MENRKTYWFPAKTYGWGWGIPTVWQGWVVLIAYLAGIVAAAVFLQPNERPIDFFAMLAVLAVVLLITCWLKGEPPKWRWGRK